MSSTTRPGIDDCACNVMRRASRQITRFYDAQLAPTGLRITQFLTLAALSQEGSVAVNALAERLDVERTAMGKMIGFLARDGLIRLRRSPTDGRSRLVELTEKGRRRCTDAMPLWFDAQRRFEQLNGAWNVAELLRGLRRITVGETTAHSPDD